MVSFVYWDPSGIVWQVPFLHITVYWYSLLFAMGFCGAYLVMVRELRHSGVEKKAASQFVDQLAIWVFIGMLVGARLGHVFFYDWGYYSEHPWKIVEFPMRGLASHGGTAGILIALGLFWWWQGKKAPISRLTTLDLLALVSALVAGFIRIGNFCNQEIVGTPTTLPWGVVFGHPAEPVTGPVHPVQLYEAAWYWGLFIVLWCSRRKGWIRREGMLLGIFLVATFAFRFFIEFVKMPQSERDTGSITMGQWLSLPFVALGLFFILRARGARSVPPAAGG